MAAISSWVLDGTERAKNVRQLVLNRLCRERFPELDHLDKLTEDDRLQLETKLKEEMPKLKAQAIQLAKPSIHEEEQRIERHLKRQKKFEEKGTTEVHVLQNIIRTCKERIRFNQFILDVVKRLGNTSNLESRKEFIFFMAALTKQVYPTDYDHLVFGVTGKEDEVTLVKDFGNAISFYLDTLKILTSHYQSPYIIDHLYFILNDRRNKIMHQFSKSSISISGVQLCDPESEYFHIDRILKEIKKHLSPSFNHFRAFREKFQTSIAGQQKLRDEAAFCFDLVEKFLNEVILNFSSCISNEEINKLKSELEKIKVELSTYIQSIEKVKIVEPAPEKVYEKPKVKKYIDLGADKLLEYCDEIREKFEYFQDILNWMNDTRRKLKMKKELHENNEKKLRMEAEAQQRAAKRNMSAPTPTGKPEKENGNGSQKGNDTLKEEKVKSEGLLLQQFKGMQQMHLESWKRFCRERNEANEAIKKQKQLISIEEFTLQEEPVQEQKGLQDFEISQLIYVYDNIKPHYQILLDLFAKTPVLKFNDLEKLVLAFSPTQLIDPSKFQDFRLLDFNRSSHFKAYIPNTHKRWARTDAKNNNKDKFFDLTPKEMSTINTWDHSTEKGHANRPFREAALKRCIEGFEKAGCTPETFELALKCRGLSNPMTRNKCQ